MTTHGMALYEAEQRAAAWLMAWDGQGVHRTGTEGDNAGAAWLAREAAALGAAPTIETFGLDRLDPRAACLEIGTQRIAGVPVFDAPDSGRDGIEGRLGPVDGGSEIGVAELSPRAVYSGEFERLRRSGGNRGFVVVCAGEQPGLGLLNAESFRHPYGTPALHVASEARDAVLAAAARQMPARLVSHSRRVPGEARNVVVALSGTDPSAAPVVVMTPRSSWWQSTAERGGGLVCWLETLRALLAAPPRAPVVLTANSGHELGHLGLDDFIARRSGWDRPVTEGGATWVHYGANIGAAGGRLQLVAPQDDIREIGLRELAGAGVPPDEVAPKNLVPSGETRDIHRAGGRYLTLVGTNSLFHLPQDRWPLSVDVAAVARVARASARIVAGMTGSA
ncbi:MAG: hypothetical protein JO001_01905 [Alphaproteobacteria bacterium]|nr:hypothetical protein [Alphaproteobacteria bacterium]